MRLSTKLAFAGVSLLSLATPAWAAEAADDATDGAIIVEARRKNEDAQDVPLTVNAVSSAAIEKLNIRSLNEISAVVPGLQLVTANAVSTQTVSVRGINNDSNVSGNNGTVEFYQNDAPLSGGVVLQAMFDVGQIEVLRGPQGTLRGRASPSGSITVTTRRPDMDSIGGYASSTINNIGLVRVEGAFNLPIVKDVLAVRVAGVLEDGEGDRVRSINSSIAPSVKTRGVRVSLRATPVDGLEINASYTRLLKKATIWDQVESANLALGTAVTPTQYAPLITARNRLSVESTPIFNRALYQVFNWQAKYSFMGQRVDYVGSITKQDMLGYTPQDTGDIFNGSFPGNAANLPTFALIAATGSNALIATQQYDSALQSSTSNLQNLTTLQHSFPKQESHELRLSSEERVAGIFDYVIGGMINKLASPTDLGLHAAVAFAGNPFDANGNYSGVPVAAIVSAALPRRGRQIERSFFGNITAHIGESTELSVGGRRINYKSNAANFPIDQTFNATLWSASLKHKFNDNLMAYVSAGSSFRVPTGSAGLIIARTLGANTTLTDNTVKSIRDTITPESSKSYEIGIKSQWFDRKLTLNLAAYHQDFTGYLYGANTTIYPFRTSDSTYLAGVASSGPLAFPIPVKLDGVEAELSFRPTPDFSIGATMAYSKSKLTGTAPATLIINGVTATAAQVQAAMNSPTAQVYMSSVDGLSASKVANFSATIQSEYSHSITDNVKGFVRGLVTYYGDSNGDPLIAVDSVKAYAPVNLFLGVRADDGAWEVTAYGKNVFSTQRELTRGASALRLAISGAPGGVGTSKYRLITSTAPREFGITARFAFGSR